MRVQEPLYQFSIRLGAGLVALGTPVVPPSALQCHNEQRMERGRACIDEVATAAEGEGEGGTDQSADEEPE